MRKTIWVSIFRLKQHEFNRTFRLVFPDTGNFVQKFRVLSELQNKAIHQLIKACGVLLTAYLVLNTFEDGALLSLKFGEITASIPKSYYLAVCSPIFLLALISLNHLVVIMSLRSSSTTRVKIPGFSANVLGLLNDHDENALGLPFIDNSYLKERLPVATILGAVLSYCLLTLLIPILAFGLLALCDQWRLLFEESTNLLEKSSNIIGISIIAAAYAYYLFFFIPLPFKKNSFSIRWGFLYNLPGPYPQEQIKRWLDDGKDLPSEPDSKE